MRLGGLLRVSSNRTSLARRRNEWFLNRNDNWGLTLEGVDGNRTSGYQQSASMLFARKFSLLGHNKFAVRAASGSCFKSLILLAEKRRSGPDRGQNRVISLLFSLYAGKRAATMPALSGGQG